MGLEFLLVTVALPRQQESPNVAVRQQWRDHATLRRAEFASAGFGGLNRPAIDTLHDWRCQFYFGFLNSLTEAGVSANVPMEARKACST